MLLHHLFGAQLRRLGHRNFIIKPWRGHHPGLTFLHRTNGTIHHVSHGVDHPNPEPGCPIRRDFHSFLRNEFRLRGHDHSPGTALRQFIPCPLLPIRVFDSRNHQLFHNSLDEGRFSRPYRPHHTNIDIATGPGRNILINIFHSQPPYPAGEWLRPVS